MQRTTWVVACLAACAGAPNPVHPTAPSRSDATAVEAQGHDAGGFDRDAIDALVAQHRHLAALARVAAARAARPALAAFADRLQRTLDVETERLLEWRRAWFGEGRPAEGDAIPTLAGVAPWDATRGWPAAPNGTAPSPVAVDPAARARHVEALSGDLDAAWVALVLPTLEYGVAQARAVQLRGERVELREVARTLRDTQERALRFLREDLGDPPRMP
jgi:uncharacterized protein (DUF305 family)